MDEYQKENKRGRRRMAEVSGAWWWDDWSEVLLQLLAL